MYLHLTTNGSYNFKAPAIDADADKKIEVVFPTQEQRDTTIDGSADVAVNRAVTVIDMTVEADATLTGVISDDVKIGDTVLIKATATGANRTLTLAANLGGKAIALTQNTEEDILLIFDGTNFVAIAAGTGSDGADGNDGDDGADGATITSDEGVPSDLNGADGDHYVDTLTFNVYKKASGTWGLIGNIKGADGNDGDDGADGKTITSNAEVPNPADGVDGDFYINTLNWDLYKKTAGTWNIIGNIKGDDGDDGVGLPVGASGDIAYHNGTAWVTLAKGADGTVLTLAGGVPTWASA